MLRDIVIKNRSYRRFEHEISVELETLRELVDMARFVASAANKQPLKYIISCEPNRNALIFPQLSWAAYLKDWGGPSEKERPSAYIVVLGDTEIKTSFLTLDAGIAAQTILLGATEKGLGGCIIASINKPGLRQALDIPPRYEILVVLALGKPAEKVVIEKVDTTGDIKYWRDKESIHHVPKRSLDEIIIS